jgi:hypothetical protein
MYANIRRYEGAGNIHEVAQLVEEEFLPIIKQIPGFFAYYAVDARYGIAITISIFGDEAGAIEANTLANNWVKENLTSTFPNAAETTCGKVVVYESTDFGKGSVQKS